MTVNTICRLSSKGPRVTFYCRLCVYRGLSWNANKGFHSLCVLWSRGFNIQYTYQTCKGGWGLSMCTGAHMDRLLWISVLRNQQKTGPKVPAVDSAESGKEKRLGAKL